MIGIGNIRDADFQQYDEVWYVTNYTPNQKIGTKHVPQLAPNRDDYTAYRRGRMSLSELLDRYEYDLRNNRLEELNALIQLSDSGVWVYCGCYCDKSTMCHRGVLYTVLSEMTDAVCLVS